MKLTEFLKAIKSFNPQEPEEKIETTAKVQTPPNETEQSVDTQSNNSDGSFIDSLILPPTMEEPDYDMTPFPYDNKPYLCRTHQQVVHNTGQIVETKKFYYGDHLAVDAVRRDVQKLEKLIAPEAINVPTLPILETNFARIEGPDCLMEFPENRIQLSLRPLTKTGRKAKFPVEISFSSYKKISFPEHTQNGSHGTISYFSSGAVGKAEINYWINHEYYGAYFKIIGGNIALNVLTYSNSENGNEVELYRAH